MGLGLNPITAIIDSVAGGVRSVGGMIFGDKEARDAQTHAELMAVQAGYVSEFTALEKKSWFNQLVDGLNRLVRPLFTFGTIGIFWWCVSDPAQFSISMQALALMPEPMWYILGAIITFWFGSRVLLDKASITMKPPTEAQVQAVLNSQEQLNKLKESYKQDKFAPKLQDPEHPVDNAVVQSWINKFRGAI